jgi:prepilin-type N-terminal cleavage/methylation domain-containing protein
MNARRGITLIELLVVISIIGFLMAILLPAVIGARASARRSVCANNIRNIGLAMLAEADAKRRFPVSGHFGTTSSGPRFHNWVVTLLPRLERRDLYLRWDFDRGADDPINMAIGRHTLNVLECPDDITVERGQGNLSYVVNGGFGYTIPTDCPATAWGDPIDMNGNGIILLTPPGPDGKPTDRDLFYRTSLFFIANWPPGTGSPHRYHSLNSISDGTSQTLMLAENARAGFDPYAGANWSWPDPQRQSFFLSSQICANLSCSAGNVDYAKANDGSADGAINSGLAHAEGQAPWPNSFHVDGVHVIYADGHLQFLSQYIDGAVYASLVSPQGGRITGPLAQRLVGDEH